MLTKISNNYSIEWEVDRQGYIEIITVYDHNSNNCDDLLDKLTDIQYDNLLDFLIGERKHFAFN